MAEHKLEIPNDKRESINHDTVLDIEAVTTGVKVTYPQFVDNLFKELDSPAASLMHATIGVAGEGGELLDVSKKTWIYGKELDLDNVLEELGDLRFYYQKMLNMLGLDDEDIQAINRVKLEKRFPEGSYTDHHAQQRLDKNDGTSSSVCAPGDHNWVHLQSQDKRVCTICGQERSMS